MYRPIVHAHGDKNPLPSPDLLEQSPVSAGSLTDQGELTRQGQALVDCLGNFGITAELIGHTPGPVVSTYEIHPSPGALRSRIAALGEDIARALMVNSFRVQDHVSAACTLNIEIGNAHREIVNFRDLVTSDVFRKGCGPLTVILGRDVAGHPYVADLAKMPHLLVAGASGTGKSVFLNSILLSLLYRLQPSDMRLLLIDSKKTEMAMYADEPHLLHPVVSDINVAKAALDWAVHEMEERYKAMAREGVRNIAQYNQKTDTYRTSADADCGKHEPFPYLVVVINELSELMLSAGKEEQINIVRLAQLARAAGIHLILATGCPTVDVVTGLIKENFPCRISFRVNSSHDSRNILDQTGAENLLDNGDMLYRPYGGRLLRLHSPFLNDAEVKEVVGHWKRHEAPDYGMDFYQWGRGSHTHGASEVADKIYEQAKEFVIQRRKVSISRLMSRFNIGFNHAAKIIEQLEAEGLVGAANGSKPRDVFTEMIF